MTKSRSNAVAPAAKGQLVVGNGTDASTTLAVASTAGYVLTVDSAEATGVKWAAASAGGMTSIASGSLSSNTVTLSTISGSYINLILYVRDYYFAADDYLNIRVNSDTGTNYGWISIGQTAEDTGSVGTDGIRDRLFAAGDDGKENADKDVFTAIQFLDYANTSHKKTIDIRTIVRSQNDVYNTQFAYFGNWNSASAITSITLFTQNTSNFSGGTYELYGVK
jgi:hypothetical protein